MHSNVVTCIHHGQWPVNKDYTETHTVDHEIRSVFMWSVGQHFGPPKTAGMCACNAQQTSTLLMTILNRAGGSFQLEVKWSKPGPACCRTAVSALFSLRNCLIGVQLQKSSGFGYWLSIYVRLICLACLWSMTGVVCMYLSGGPPCTDFRKWQHRLEKGTAWVLKLNITQK
jgi:hypothetical protein